LTLCSSLTDKNEKPISVKAQLQEGKRQGKIKTQRKRGCDADEERKIISCPDTVLKLLSNFFGLQNILKCTLCRSEKSKLYRENPEPP